MCPARPSSKAGRHLSCPQTPLRRRAVGAGPRRGPHARPGSWPRGLTRRPWTLRGRRCWWSPLGCGALRAGAHVGGRVALRGPAPLGRTARLTLATPGADTCPRGKDAPAARPQPPLSWPRWRRWAVTTVGPLPGSSPAAASQGPEASEPASRGPVGSAGPGPACRLCLQPEAGEAPGLPRPGLTLGAEPRGRVADPHPPGLSPAPCVLGGGPGWRQLPVQLRAAAQGFLAPGKAGNEGAAARGGSVPGATPGREGPASRGVRAGQRTDPAASEHAPLQPAAEMVSMGYFPREPFVLENISMGCVFCFLLSSCRSVSG